MADEVVRIKLVSEAGQYIGEMRLAAKATEKLGDAVDTVEDKQGKLDKTTKKTTASVERAKAAAQALGGRYGELAGRAEAAAKAGGALGVAVGAAAVALTASAAAATKMVTEAVNLTRHLGEITDRADELALIGAGLNEADVALVEDANDALDRLAGTFDRLLVTVAGSSGFVESMGDAADAVNGVILAVDNLENAQRPATKATMENINGIRDFVLAYTGVTPALRAAGKAIELVSDSTSDLIDEQKAAAEEAQNLAEIQALEAERQAMEAKVAEARANDERKRLAARAKASEDAIKLAEQEFEARRAFFEAEDELFFAQQAAKEEAQRKALEDTITRLDEEVAAEVAAQEAIAEARRAANEEAVDLTMRYADAVISLGDDILAAELERLEASGAQNVAATKRVFALQKAADMASTIISTARAVMSAYAMPPGPPITTPIALAVGAAGAVQIAKISSQSFHMGSRAGDLAPDEVQARLTRGEAVLTRQAQTTLGLDSNGVADANAGIGTERPIVMVYQHDRVSARYHRDAAKLAQLGAAPNRRVGRREKF